MGPFDTCIIVIVQKRRRRETLNFVADLRDAARKISKINNLFQGHVSGTNFSLTRAERRTLLMLAKSTKRTTVLETMPPFILQNLKWGRRVPSATRLPI